MFSVSFSEPSVILPSRELSLDQQFKEVLQRDEGSLYLFWTFLESLDFQQLNELISCLDSHPELDNAGTSVLRSLGSDVIRSVLEKEVGEHKAYARWIDTYRYAQGRETTSIITTRQKAMVWIRAADFCECGCSGNWPNCEGVRAFSSVAVHLVYERAKGAKRIVQQLHRPASWCLNYERHSEIVYRIGTFTQRAPSSFRREFLSGLRRSGMVDDSVIFEWD